MESTRILPTSNACITRNHHKIFNDPIHGHIELHPLCVKILDTPQFQRLRYIRQLGGSYLVFPGASHNRFEHCLGVCHLAGEMVKVLRNEQPELEITDRDVLCVQIAGLCHDLGHGPFSHLFDGMFIPKIAPQDPWKHEDSSVAMLDYLLDSNNIQFDEYGLEEPKDRDFIKELIVGPGEDGEYKGRKDKHFLYQIVANKDTGIDVDKWDYFARDCHHLGISSIFDHLRLMKFTRVIRDGDKWQICFRDKEVSNVYDMFHTRQILHRRAYQHKTAVGIEHMITDAFVAANDHIKIPGKDGVPRRLSECIYDMAAYTKLNDHVFHMILCSTEPSLAPARDLLQRVETRQLYKCMGQAKPRKNRTIKKNDIEEYEQEIIAIANDKILDKYDLFISVVTFDYGMKDKDPVDNVRFYTKDNLNMAKKIPRDQVSHMLPESFQDQILRVYCRSLDPLVMNEVAACFKQWCSTHTDSIEVPEMIHNPRRGIGVPL